MTRVYRLTGRLTATILVVVGLVVLVGTTPLLDAEASGQKLRPVPRTVLALGDSVPAGTACGCNPFPDGYGSMLSQRTIGGFSTADLATTNSGTLSGSGVAGTNPPYE